MEPLLTKMARHLNLKRVAIAGLCSIVLDFAISYVLISAFFYLEDSTSQFAAVAQGILFWTAAIISWPILLLMIISPPGSLEMALPFGVIGTALFWGLVFEVVYSRPVARAFRRARFQPMNNFG
jgi:hypothetical protein